MCAHKKYESREEYIKMDSEYLYRAIAQFVRADDFHLFPFTCVVARDRAFARDFAIVRDVWAMDLSPVVSARNLIKRAACIDSLFARFPSSYGEAYLHGIKNACARGHDNLAKWYMTRAQQEGYSSLRNKYVAWALKGAYINGDRALIDYFLAMVTDEGRSLAYSMAICGALRSRHVDHIEWRDPYFRSLHHFASVEFVYKGIAAAIQGGHPDIHHLDAFAPTTNEGREVAKYLWSYALKRNVREYITECIHAYGRAFTVVQLRELWQYASEDVIREFMNHFRANELDMGWIWMGIQAICEDENFARIRMAFSIVLEYEPNAGCIRFCFINNKYHNPAIIAFLGDQIARMLPMQKNEGVLFLKRLVDKSSVAMLQYIMDHAHLMNMQITTRCLHSLARRATSSEMCIFLAQQIRRYE